MRKKSNANVNSKDSQKTRRGKLSGRSSKYEDKGITKDDVRNSSNDPAWYASDPAILRDAASFPFSWPAGASETHDPSLWSSTNKAPYYKVPGICTLINMPTIGFTIRATDPVNVAAQSIYSFVRHANSGHSNYDAPDLMLYILAMANSYSYLVWCQRLYGYALTYDQRNRYIPTELLRLNNVDADDLRANLANFRFWINTLIAKMASFAVPATFSIFSRMSFMYSDYYIEGTSIKEQLYQYVPAGFYVFGLDANQKGKLTWTPFDRTQLMSVNDIMTYGNTLFGSIWNQEDFGIMSGDILKAYGDRIIKLSSIPEAYSIAPKFDPMVLTQMKNALILEAAGSDIDQVNGIIRQILVPKTYDTTFTWFGMTNALSAAVAALFNTARLSYMKDFKSLTVDTDQPTPDVVMEASRLMYGYDAYLGEVRTGTEVTTAVLVTYDVGNDVEFRQCNFYDCFDSTYLPSAVALMEALQYTKNFHYMPRIVGVGPTASGVISTMEWFDLDNFAILDNADIAKLHQAAVINMYAVPSIGRVQ